MKKSQAKSRQRICALALALCVSLLSSQTASAALLEQQKARQGYYFSLGASFVLNARHDRETGLNHPWPGAFGSLRIGQAVFDWLDLGIGIGAGAALQESYVATLGNLAMEFQLRPLAPLMLRAGVGFGVTDFTRRKNGAEAITGQFGAYYSMAVGYELYLGKPGDSGGWAIAPVVGFGAGIGDPLSSFVWSLGVELTFWTGLPRDQLNLPAGEAFTAP